MLPCSRTNNFSTSFVSLLLCCAVGACAKAPATGTGRRNRGATGGDGNGGNGVTGSGGQIGSGGAGTGGSVVMKMNPFHPPPNTSQRSRDGRLIASDREC